MTERAKQRSVSNELEQYAPERFRSLLIPVDLTPISDRVLARVALLPLSDRARLTLLHVVPKSLPAGDRRIAERNAKKLLADETKIWRSRCPRASALRRW